MIEVREPAGDQVGEVHERLRGTWGEVVARRGAVIAPTACSLLGAYDQATLVGVAAHDIAGDQCEVVAIEAFPRRQGTGQVLMDAVAAAARRAGCRRLWLITTNDNTPALRFYQRWGMDLVDVHLGAVDEARATHKPTIPERGTDGIPIRHELELAVDLR